MDDVALVMIGIDPSRENADIFAAGEPVLYESHHRMDWGADLYPSSRYYRLSKSSIQIYPNPSMHFFPS